MTGLSWPKLNTKISNIHTTRILGGGVVLGILSPVVEWAVASGTVILAAATSATANSNVYSDAERAAATADDVSWTISLASSLAPNFLGLLVGN